MSRRWFAAPYGIWAAIFTVVPLCMLLIYGVTESSGDGMHFSVANIQKAFEPIYFMALMRSFGYAFVATIICLILAYPLASILASRQSTRGAVIFIFVLPMWMNFLLRTYAWLSLLETNNGFLNTVLRFLHLPTLDIIGTPSAVILGMVYNFLPFMVLPIYNTLIKIDPSVLEAAHDLGANNFQRLYKVILPLSIPGIVSGITMVFMPAVSTFVIPNLLGSGKIFLIGNVIEQQFLQAYNWYFGASLSLVLMIMILLSMGIVSRFEDDEVGGSLL